MRVRWGNYLHDDGEVGVAFHKQPLRTEGQLQYGVAETWVISGFLQANNLALLQARIQALEFAYSFNNQTISLLDSLGNVGRTMAGVTEIGGTQVVDFSYPEDGRADAEYSTFRRYVIRVEGRYQLPVGNVLLSWAESVTFVGGGPRFVHKQPLTGLPQKQYVAQATPFRAVQRGTAVGLKDWPLPPGPVWPADEHTDRRQITPGHPKRSGGAVGLVFTEYPVEWSYEFEASAPLVGQPTLWTG
jgi:hypothetical protein